MNPSGIFANAGGRRFFLALVVVLFSYVCIWFGKISDSILRDIILGVAAVYVAGNTIQKIKAPQTETET